MAVFNITNADLQNDGWSMDILCDGQGVFVGDTEYFYDLGVNNDPSIAAVVLTVTSLGFDATGTPTTIERTVYGTKTVRNPYPGQLTLDEENDAGDLKIRVALSAPIYPDDIVTIAIGEAWLTTDSGLNENDAFAGSLVVSPIAPDYPKALGKWDNVHGTMSADRVTGDFDLCVLPVAGHGVAAVKIIVTDTATGLVEHSAFINTPEAVEYTVSEVFAFCHRGTVPIATFTDGGVIDGDLLTCNFEVYPKIGDAGSVYKSSVSGLTAKHEAYCRNAVTVVYDTSALIYAVVSGSPSGTPVTSTDPLVAKADPYATWGDARNTNANVIYYEAGTYDFVGALTLARTTDEWVRAMPYPGVERSAVHLELDELNDYRLSRASFENITMVTTGFIGWGVDGNDNDSLRFKDVTFLGSGVAPGLGLHYRSNVVYVHNCDGDFSGEFWSARRQNSLGLYALEGCSFGGHLGGDADEVNISPSTIGCTFIDGWSLQVLENTDVGNPDGFIIGFNKFMNYPHAGNPGHGAIYGFNDSYAIGFALINNIVESTVQDTGTLHLAQTLENNQSWNNVIVANNTFVGERWNGPYNADGATPGIVTNMFRFGNLYFTNNIKTDTYDAADPPPNPNGLRVGNWSVLYGVSCTAGVAEQISGGNLAMEFAGLNMRYPASDFSFVDDGSYSSGDASGNGDYHLVEGASAIGVATDIFIPFDIEGTARFIDSVTNGGAAGAYEFGTQATGPGAGYRGRYGTGVYRGRYGSGGRYR